MFLILINYSLKNYDLHSPFPTFSKLYKLSNFTLKRVCCLQLEFF